MTASFDDPVSRAPMVGTAHVVAALLVTVALVAAALLLRGDWNPDWTGYEAIYLDDGAWLADQGRDPLFTWIVQGARELFPHQEYGSFRLWLFIYFLVFALFLVRALPPALPQTVWGGLGFGVMVIAILFTKSTVQVREGLALTLLLAAMFRIVRPWTNEAARSTVSHYLLLVGAGLIHRGTATYLLAYGVAHICSYVLGDRVRGQTAQRILLGFAAASAIVTGYHLEHSIEMATDALQELGVTLDAQGEWSFPKFIYWLTYGMIVFAVRRQCARIICKVGSQRAAAFVTAHTSFILPFLYVLSFYMAATGQLSAAASIVARLLHTAVGIAIFLLLLRGHATRLTVAAALFLIVDQVRTIHAATFDTG